MERVIQVREFIRGKQENVRLLSRTDLILVAENAVDPAYPSQCVDWAEKEAVPLLHELARRLKAASGGPVPQGFRL